MSEHETRDLRLETERLVLRPMKPSDAGFILRLLNEPSFLRFVGDRGVRTAEDAEAYIARGPQDSYRHHGYGPLLVETGDSRVPLGMCGLMRKPWLDAPDLAYAFVSEATGKGYAVEAARAVLEHYERRPGLERILAVVVPEHAASIRLLEKVGFLPAGTLLDPGDGAELNLYVRNRGAGSMNRDAGGGTRKDRREAQLVSELSVRDLENSLRFYTSIGFELERRTGSFAVLRWDDDNVIFLDEQPDLPPMRAMYANVRIMVADVEAWWERVRSMDVTVEQEISDRPYGLREFTLVDPDGFGVRFATPI